MENYKKINKPTARKMYNCGHPVLLLPCNVSDEAVEGKSDWIKPVTISIFDTEEDSNKFDRTVNSYAYYNCNAELGYYPHYYVSLEEWDKYQMCNMMCN